MSDYNPVRIYEVVNGLPLQQRKNFYFENGLSEEQQAQLESWIAARPPPPPPGPVELQQIGLYRVLEKVGDGGMGVVYKARQLEPIQRDVAVKIIKSGMDTKEVLARFELERQALALMNHPNIARILDAGQDSLNRPYFVMEYVPGKPVTTFADEERLTVSERLKLMLQICDAVTHAHSKGLLHRDIKATNVLALMQDGRPVVKVIDFGIAKAIGALQYYKNPYYTQTGASPGAYISMSPEQVEGLQDIDWRADVYSLGTLLYELLTGVSWLESRYLLLPHSEIMRVIKEVDPVKPRARLLAMDMDSQTATAAARSTEIDSLAKQLGSPLQWIVLTAMSKARKLRYKNPDKMAEDIQNYLTDKIVTAAPPSYWYSASTFIKRHRWPVTTVAACLLSLTVAAIAFVDHSNATARLALEKARQTEEDQQKAFESQEKAYKDAMIAYNAEEAAHMLLILISHHVAEPKATDHSFGSYKDVETKARISELDDYVARLDSGALWLLSEKAKYEPWLRYYIGRGYMNLGALTKAESQFKRVRASTSDRRLISYQDFQLGCIALGERPPDGVSAESHFKGFLAFPPHDVSAADLAYAQDSLGIALGLENELPESEAADKRALEMYGALASKPLLDREFYLEPGINDEAIFAEDRYPLTGQMPLSSGLRRAPRLDLDELIATKEYHLGGTLETEGKLTEAEQAYRKPLEDPDHVHWLVMADTPELNKRIADNLYSVYRVLGKEGKLNQCKEVFSKLINGCKDDSALMSTLGVQLEDNQLYEEAEMSYRKAIEVMNKDEWKEAEGNTVKRLAGLLQKMGKASEAKQLLRSLTSQPTTRTGN